MGVRFTIWEQHGRARIPKLAKCPRRKAESNHLADIFSDNDRFVMNDNFKRRSVWFVLVVSFVFRPSDLRTLGLTYICVLFVFFVMCSCCFGFVFRPQGLRTLGLV